MTIAMNPNFTYTAESSYANSSLPALPTLKVALSEEQGTDFSTIDGNVVTYNAGATAVNIGTGIFIGDYFVGESENQQTISSLACIRY
ncbi:hypothetical protein [Pontibacter vulgaris]|uniref:hypothetical protein n=1 Tax=Pontibacter vulgaris TaxID=2905679 RepID=UPI001FA700FC|nr:hypothetical protein [Pontibacter vulgaris]